MRRKIFIWAGCTILAVSLGGLVAWQNRTSLLKPIAIVLNSVRSFNSPTGTLTLEVNELPIITPHSAVLPLGVNEPNPADWPSYNRTLASDRFSPLDQITAENAGDLKTVCIYDTNLYESFETGPLIIDGNLILTTMSDTISIDASNCKERWRVHDPRATYGLQTVNRGAAYLDGRLFRGTLDGRVVAYDFKTGKQLWQTFIGDASKGEIVDAAPIASNGMVFIGNAGGDSKSAKGRMYALDAKSGTIVWETFMVPKTASDKERGPQGKMPEGAESTWANAGDPEMPISGGAFWTSFSVDASAGVVYAPAANPSPDFDVGVREGRNLFTNAMVALDMKTGNYLSHVQTADSDWHDWDVSNAPALITTRAGKQIFAFSPKDGHIYSYERTTGSLLFRSPVTRVANDLVPITAARPVHFCPGSVGGGEWNGVAYEPSTNLLFSGEGEWCTTIQLNSDNVERLKSAKIGKQWSGIIVRTPIDFAGKQDSREQWGGWLYATDADSGQWKWRLKSNYPILGGVTATAGGLVAFGDIGGNFYVVNTRSGKRVWSIKLDGGIGGGVTSYSVRGAQRIAVAAGFTSVFWPVKWASAKIFVFGL